MAALLLWVMMGFWRVGDNLALNTKIAKIVFNQWDKGVCQERILMLQLRFGPPRSEIQHPKPSVKFLAHFRGFRWKSLYALQTTCSQFFPL